MPAKHGFNLAQLHPEAAHFDLMVEAAKELQTPVGQGTHKIPCLIHAGGRLGPKSIPDKPLPCQLRPIAVASSDAVSTNTEFTRNANCHRLANGIENIESLF